MQGLNLDLPSLALPGVVPTPTDCRRKPWPMALSGSISSAGFALIGRPRLPPKAGHAFSGLAKVSAALS